MHIKCQKLSKIERFHIKLQSSCYFIVVKFITTNFGLNRRQNSVEHQWEFDMYMPEMLEKHSVRNYANIYYVKPMKFFCLLTHVALKTIITANYFTTVFNCQPGNILN